MLLIIHLKSDLSNLCPNLKSVARDELFCINRILTAHHRHPQLCLRRILPTPTSGTTWPPHSSVAGSPAAFRFLPSSVWPLLLFWIYRACPRSPLIVLGNCTHGLCHFSGLRFPLLHLRLCYSHRSHFPASRFWMDLVENTTLRDLSRSRFQLISLSWLRLCTHKRVCVRFIHTFLSRFWFRHFPFSISGYAHAISLCRCVWFERSPENP